MRNCAGSWCRGNIRGDDTVGIFARAPNYSPLEDTHTTRIPPGRPTIGANQIPE